MRFTTKNLAVTAAFYCLTSAHANNVVQVGDSGLHGGTLTWNVSAQMREAFDVLQLGNTAIEPAVVEEKTVYDPDFDFDVRTESRTITPLSAITIDNNSKIIAIDTAGGMNWTVPKVNYVSEGGSLTIDSIHVDLSNKRVYASLTGDFSGAATGMAGNGTVSRIDNFYLWDIGTVHGYTGFQPSFVGTINPLQFSNLTITQEGFNHFVSALRLEQFGVATLSSVTDYGTLAAPVPEPGTAAMGVLGAGLAGMLAHRRRFNSQSGRSKTTI